MDPSARVIKHMNADHQDSLVLLLQHRHGLSSWAARNARMAAMDLHSITVETSKGTPYKPRGPDLARTYRVALDPPLASWAEARERLVAMDRAARTALGRDSLTLKGYHPPRRPLHVLTFAACVVTYILLFRRANLSRDTCPRLLRPLLDLFPGAAAFLWRVQPKVFYPMVVIHVVETMLLDQTRLQRYNVAMGSGLWWKWVLGTFIEGFPNFHRIDEWADAERERQSKAKH